MGSEYPSKGFLAFSTTSLPQKPVPLVLRLTADEVKKNKERYQSRGTHPLNPHQVKCYDALLAKDVWGTYQDANPETTEKVFVPNPISTL